MCRCFFFQTRICKTKQIEKKNTLNLLIGSAIFSHSWMSCWLTFHHHFTTTSPPVPGARLLVVRRSVGCRARQPGEKMDSPFVCKNYISNLGVVSDAKKQNVRVYIVYIFICIIMYICKYIAYISEIVNINTSVSRPKSPKICQFSGKMKRPCYGAVDNFRVSRVCWWSCLN